MEDFSEIAGSAESLERLASEINGLAAQAGIPAKDSESPKRKRGRPRKYEPGPFALMAAAVVDYASALRR